MEHVSQTNWPRKKCFPGGKHRRKTTTYILIREGEKINETIPINGELSEHLEPGGQ